MAVSVNRLLRCQQVKSEAVSPKPSEGCLFWKSVKLFTMTIFYNSGLLCNLLKVIFLSRIVKAAEHPVTCIQASEIEVAAYTFWPFRIDCGHLEAIRRISPHNSSGDTFECVVSHNGTNYSAGIFELSSSAEGLIYETKLIMNGSHCLSSTVKVKLMAFPEGTCGELLNAADLKGEIINKQTTVLDYVELRCKPPDGTPTLIPNGVDRKLFTTTWLTNCEKAFYRTNKLEKWEHLQDPDGYPDTLSMRRVDFYHAANFTCKVTYRGRSLYPVTYAQCVKQSLTMKDPSLHACTKSEREPRGGLAQLNCGAQITNGLTSSDDFAVEWMQGDNIICRNTFFNHTSQGMNSRITCIVEGHNETLPCIVDGKVEYKMIPHSTKKITLLLNISRLQGNDFGEYYVKVKFRNNGHWLQDAASSITLEEDLIPFYKKLVVGLSTGFVILILLVLIWIVIWRNWIYILVVYKRSRLRKYDEDSNKWVAYLSYHFDRDAEDETAKRSSETTIKIIRGIHKVMEKLGHPYYDEQKQTNVSVAVESAVTNVENCHCMILILTPEYFEDKWRRFHAELGLRGLLESRIGFVFVLTPGSLKALKKRAGEDAVWRTLLVTLKTSHVIKWKESMSDAKLSRHIEYALPKQRSRKLHPICGKVSAKKEQAKQRVSEHERYSSLNSTTPTPDNHPSGVNNCA